MRRFIIVPLSAGALLLGLAGCAAAPKPDASPDSVEVSEKAILLDVRTAEEYAAGRLEGAQLLDFNAGDVAAAVPNLDPAAEYLVYCRSGNRSGQAIALMERAGFANLTNLGSLEEAGMATKLPIVN